MITLTCISDINNYAITIQTLKLIAKRAYKCLHFVRVKAIFKLDKVTKVDMRGQLHERAAAP